MYTRLLTFRNVTDVDAGIGYLRDEVLSILDAQHGFRGVTASADRPGALVGILSLWDTESDRSASDSALGKAREEAVKVMGGELTSIENFEQVAEYIVRPPAVGSSLIVTRVSMDPASVDEHVVFFKSEMVPRISNEPGFCALRNMIDRASGHGVVGTVWRDKASMEAFASGIDERRAPAIGRGITFDETSFREILLAELR